MAAGTDIREIQGVRWKDDLAWMEEMKGSRWQSLLHKHKKRWDALKKSDDTSDLIEKELEAAKQVSKARLFRAGKVELSIEGTNTICWNWIGQEEEKSAADLDWCRKLPNYVWVTEDNSAGCENYTLKAYRKGTTIPLWQQTSLGPFVAVVGGRCFSLESKNKLIYWRLVSWDCVKGDDYRIHYEETDSRYNLEIIRCSCSAFYLRRQSGGKEDVFEVRAVAEKIQMKTLAGISLEPRKFILDISQPGKYFLWTSAGGASGGWKSSGRITSNDLSLAKEVSPEILWTERNLLITRCQGKRVIWKLSPKPQKIWEGYANITVDSWGGTGWVRIQEPLGTIWWDSEADARPHKASQIGCVADMKVCKKGDVTYLLLVPEKYKNVLVTGYGAYGLPTPVSAARWIPLLHRGWAIAIGFWRGGGDCSPSWAESGRLTGRLSVLEEVHEVILDIQKRLGLEAGQTVVYGRSAGGLFAGGIVAKYGSGLIGGAYMEVPYLDVLQTTTNPALPLTDLETDEFGNPQQRLSDFIEMLKWSPMELLLQNNPPAKGVKQIIRTGLNDSEVFAYESAKWVERCGANAFLAVEGGQGHFVGGSVGLKQQAEDLAVLNRLFN
jgi:hypothetical protein